MPDVIKAGRLSVTAAATGQTLLQFLAEELGLSNRKAKAALDRPAIARAISFFCIDFLQ